MCTLCKRQAEQILHGRNYRRGGKDQARSLLVSGIAGTREGKVAICLILLRSHTLCALCSWFSSVFHEGSNSGSWQSSGLRATAKSGNVGAFSIMLQNIALVRSQAVITTPYQSCSLTRARKKQVLKENLMNRIAEERQIYRS